jgi:hypothetical protein
VRTRSPRAVDASMARFQPERFYRQQPRYRFGGDERALSWRDLVLPEHALHRRPGA